MYLFRDKFEVLLPGNKYLLTNDTIGKWIEENKMENFVLWLDEIMTMAR